MISLEAFGRRPRCKPHRCDRPASETLNKSGLSFRVEQYACRAKFYPPYIMGRDGVASLPPGLAEEILRNVITDDLYAAVIDR